MKHKDLFSDLRVQWTQANGLESNFLRKTVNTYNEEYAEKEKLFRLYIESSEEDLWNVWSSKFPGEVFVSWDNGIIIKASFVLKNSLLEEYQNGFYSVPDFEREYAKPYFRYVDFFVGSETICSFDMGLNIPLSLLDTGDKEVFCCRLLQQPYICSESIKIMGWEQLNEAGSMEGRYNRRLFDDFLRSSRQ